MECASKFVERAIDFVLDLSTRQVGYIIHYRENVSELKGLVEDLGYKKERVEHGVGEAENNLGIIEGDVGAWLRDVDETISKTEEFQKDERHTKVGCSSGLLPYLWYRHRLGREAKKKIVDVNSLINKSKSFDEVSYQQNPTSIDVALSNASYIEFGSRKSTVDNTMAKLEDSTVRMIGVFGPGGVGKSTLIKEIAKKAQDKKLFNVVVKVEITDNPNLQKIQEEIAYVLGLRLEGEGETVRADCLRRRLKAEKENTLIILDDLWDRLDLNKIGIPFDDDDGDDLSHMTIKDKKDPPNFEMVKKVKPFGDHKGCKILLTSRDRKVLSDKMDVKSIFDVKALDYNDASMLFKKVAGINGKMSNLQQEIVEKYCESLPMAIVTVGKALRNKGESVWEATLEKLKKEELNVVHKSMEISVKLSYDHLESEELKSIFLLCAQMGHQPLIMHLVKYCFGLGILEGVYTLREARDRIYTSIQKLKDSSLMLDGSSNDNFNMHDMVRDAALSIAHKEQNVFALRNGKLDDWPDKDELEKCTAISIRNSDIIDELPEVINCPQLKFFQIDSDDPSLKIPERFFEGMKKLRVLILTGFHLTCLPSSIKCLSNLRMLCLERCILVDNLSIIGELKKLRILNFSGSRIDNFPAELGCLDKLQFLDISDCFITKGVPPNVISRLACLEELYIRKSLNTMKVDGETNQNQISFLSQLKQLHQLKVVDLCIPCAAVLPKDLFFDRLNDYKIVIGDFKLFSVGDFKMPNKYEALRSLALQLKDGTDIHSQKGIMLLFRRVENLLLGELDGVQNVFYELNLDGFPDLIHLSITNNSAIEYIIKSMEPSHPHNVFPNLESLCLYKLRSMRMICCSLVTDASFTKLKTIKVQVCPYLKNLFSFYMVKFVSSLETIDVSECDSLEMIVVKDGQANSDKVEFHNLRSLTLESLPSFTSFYTNIEMSSGPQLMEGQTTNKDHLEITIAIAEDEHSVFCELVELPNLESLKLSSINSYKIWPLSCSSFQNLIKLVVEDCNELRYLCSLSVASNLKKLKGLYISNCGMMEKIFITEGNNVNEVCIFPKLEEIHLTELNMLTDIWPVEVSADSFSSLISVQIEWCKKLDKVFPGHMTGGWVRSLDSLKVAWCESVEVIFEIKDSNQIDASRMDTKLQHIHLRGLKNLKQVWDRDPGGILNFKNLRNIKVFNCRKLRYVLPASVAKDLERLENISIESNDKIEEIVVWEDGSRTPLVLPEVTYIELYDLSNIKRFYKSEHPIECPRLKRLIVHNCEKLETFTIETTNEERQPVFSVEKVISNLECMEIDSKEALWLRNNYGKYRMHGVKELTLHSLESIELLYWFLRRMPNLERLSLWCDSGLKELVPSENIAAQERLGTVLQLKALTLLISNIKDIGFERDPVLQRLERLVLKYCGHLINLAPSSVSLTHLTYLEVYRCYGLINLMSSSTAKSMVQLATMKVNYCDNVKEIVTNEGNEEDGVIEVEFSKLISIELVRLKNLTSFCSFKNCKFKFPSLERLIVEQCPKLEIFTESHPIAPKLQNILAVEGEEEEKRYWEGDLNSTVQKVYKDKVSFEYMDILDLSYYPELVEQVWHHNALVQDNIFHNLKTLRVEGCSNLVHAIPSHLLPCFENLEELRVRSCSAVQVIFNISDMRVTKALVGTFRLKSLSVERCNSLKSLFPPLVAKNLTELEELRVTHCTELVEIISKDEIAIEEGATMEFVFPRVTSLELTELPGLKYFYPGLHKLEWPVLKKLDAYDCHLAVLKCQEDHPGEQALIQIEKIPSFEKLSFCIGDTKVIWNRGSQILQLEKLQRFQEESDSVLYGFLGMLPNIKKLKLHWGLLEEMFSAEKPDAEYTKVLLHLKELELYSPDDLNSIGLEHSLLHPIPENLQSLKVYFCKRLINLVPCAVFFSNLTYLRVHFCNTLLYLFTSSTARSLAQLKEMKIEWCRSMQEIVSTEGDESKEDEKIIFGQLQTLYLEDLPQLKCFYPGNFTLCFPSMEQVSIINCKWMKTFCPANKINPTKLSSGVTFLKDSTPQWEGDLNSTVLNKYEEEILKSATETSLVILRDDLLQEIWHGSLPAPDTCFSNLECLIVDGCQFLSEVLPSNLLPFFTKMKKLNVRNCSFVKTIFDVKCVIEDRKMTTVGPALLPLSFSLEQLILKQLPNLENVWNGDPQGILRVQLLQEVHVDDCKCLTSLFPVSVAKDLVKLEKLVVKHCKGLITVVTDDDHTDPAGTNRELIFPCMTSLTLQELPQLQNFYCSRHCDMLKISTHQEPHTEDKVICIEKLTPNLQSLSLGEKELKIICLGNLSHKLKILVLLSFHIESDELPYGFLQQLPNIEKLVVFSSSFKEIFCFQRPDVDYTGFLSQLKVLRLELLSELISIGLEHSWIEPFLKNLEIMEVIGCSRLRNLAVSPICFSNLMHLSVSECHGLVNLFTSSTAKSLARLKKMKISCCKSMQEIVSTEVDETEKDEKVIFGQLQTLHLEDLPQLRCFYSGNFALCFPSLKNVAVIKCCWLKTFAPINIIDPTKLSIMFKFWLFERPGWEGDLNSIVRQRFEKQILLSAPKTSLSLRDDPLQEIWHGSLPAPYRCFSELEHLIVNGCQFLSEVLPSNLLPFFSKMKKLEVRNCTSVKTIFDVKCVTKDKKMTIVGPALLPFSFSLEELILEQLPNLENVWNEDPQGILRVPLLQEVHVDDCKCLTSLFPVSMAKDLVKLEKLAVKHCKGLITIVTDDDHTDPEGTNLELTFPCMTSLTLKELPQLKNFYCSLHCDMLKISTHQEPHTEDKVICIEKLTPNLMGLSLGEKNLAASLICFSNLMHLFVSECHGLVNLFTSSTANSLAGLKKMEIICCKSMQEIVSTEGYESHEDEQIIFEQLQCLYLKDLPELKCFYPGNFTLCFPSLEQVSLINCHKMKTFCPGSMNADKLLGVNFQDESDAIPLKIDLNSTIGKAFLAMDEYAIPSEIDLNSTI